MRVGDIVGIRGPAPGIGYREDLGDCTLLMIGTGTGGGALLGIAREALAAGHRGPIRILHGGREESDLYLAGALEALAGRTPTLSVEMAASRQATRHGPARRVADLAFAEAPDPDRTALFLCGAPDMVTGTAARAARLGLGPDRIFTDSHEPFRGGGG